MDIKEKILKEINPAIFFSRYNPNFIHHNGLDEYNIACVFHEDNKPSLSINLAKGLWFCHTCNKGGSIFDYYMQLKGCDFRQAIVDIAKEFNIDIGSYGTEENPYLTNQIDDVLRCNKDLKDNIDDSLTYVRHTRGVSETIIDKFKIGYSVKTKRTTFPIYDENGNLLNVRQHSRHKRDRDNGLKVLGVKGHNQVRLWPFQALKENIVFIFAGEFDCMLAHSLGIDGAITKTGGENLWHNKWNNYFKDKNVIITYDNDKAGFDGSSLIATNLFGIAKSVKVIKLPVEDKGEDFTDYIIKYNHTILEFIELVKQTEPFKVNTETVSTIKVNDEINDVTLYQSSLDTFYSKTVRFKAICAGKDLNPYLVPKKIIVECDMGKDKTCSFCKLLAMKGKYVIEYKENDPDILEYVSSSQTQKLGIIKKKIGVVNCSNFSVTIMLAQNIEECYLCPAIDFKADNFEDTYRKIFFLGQGLNLNNTYEFIGITTPDPRDQHSVIMVNKVSGSETDIESFKIDEKIYDELKFFQPKEKTVKGIRDFYEEKYNDLSNNIIQIYNRMDLFIAIDLVFHSALKFKFQNVNIEKSHAECLIIGDTRTGKSVTAKRMINHYMLGEIINCERATIPGLIGGTFDIGSRKILTWGVIPRNDRRLVVLDEADGIDTETISNLSGIRSSCIAERTIAGGTRKTLARTRLIWIANPRGFRNLSEYTTGIEAVKTLVGKPEDIARFDFVIAISQNDVSLDVINKHIEANIPHIFTSYLCNKLLLWGWSRKDEDIKFTKEATESILNYATAFGKMFSADIPIVHPNEQRIKFARLAAAIAIATFSTTNGNDVIVDKQHIDFIVEYLIEIYSNPALAYSSYSKNKMIETTVDNEKQIMDKVKFGFESQPSLDSKYDAKYFINKMLGSYKIKFDDIMDSLQTGDREVVRETRQFLLINRCIKKEHSYWVVTEPFRNMLRKLQNELK